MSSKTFGGIGLIALLCVWIADAQTTVRPYKFGFNIDEQQHRSEQRDERGIVMGEFGFITADGIYHVTVYATDEEGRFRILAMRSYPYEAQPKIIEMVVAPKSKPQQAPKNDVAKFNFNTMACSGCFLKNSAPKSVTTPADISKTKTPIQTLSKPLSRITPGGPGNVPSAVTGTKPMVAIQRGMAEKALTQVLSDVSILDRLEAPIRTTVVGGVQHVKNVFQMAEATQSHRHQQISHKVNTQTIPTLHQTTQEPYTEADHLHTAESVAVQQIAHTPFSSTQTRYPEPNSHTNTNTNNPISPSTATYLTKTKPGTSGSQITNTKSQGKGPEIATSFALPNYVADFPLSVSRLGQIKPASGIPGKSATGLTGTFKGTGIQQNDERSSSVGSKGGSIGGIGTDVQQTDQRPSSVGSKGESLGGISTGVQKTDKRPSSVGSKGGSIGGIGKGKATSNTGSGRGGIVGAKAADGDLYRFKYNLDYHGHKETGSRNGNKVGSYVVIGDDNIERTLEYIANENGYYPKIKWRKLDTPVASKDNTLKESEFVWFSSKK